MNHIHNFFPVKGAAITGEITIGDWIFDTLNFDVGVTEDTKDLRYSTTAIRLPLQDGQYYGHRSLMEEKRLSSGEKWESQTLQRSCRLEPLFL